MRKLGVHLRNCKYCGREFGVVLKGTIGIKDYPKDLRFRPWRAITCSKPCSRDLQSKNKKEKRKNKPKTIK